MYLCVPYGSHSEQRLFCTTALTDWALWRRRNMFPVRYELNLYVVLIRNSVLSPDRYKYGKNLSFQFRCKFVLFLLIHLLLLGSSGTVFVFQSLPQTPQSGKGFSALSNGGAPGEHSSSVESVLEPGPHPDHVSLLLCHLLKAFVTTKVCIHTVKSTCTDPRDSATGCVFLLTVSIASRSISSLACPKIHGEGLWDAPPICPPFICIYGTM
jgi:hypothetical protein